MERQQEQLIERWWCTIDMRGGVIERKPRRWRTGLTASHHRAACLPRAFFHLSIHSSLRMRWQWQSRNRLASSTRSNYRPASSVLRRQVYRKHGAPVSSANSKRKPQLTKRRKRVLPRWPRSNGTGFAPFLWTPSDCSQEVFRCRELIHPTRRNTGARWLSWFARETGSVRAKSSST